MNTYTVTFYSEPDVDPEEVDLDEVNATEVRVTSDAIDADNLAAGDWDEHEYLVAAAAKQGCLGDEWNAAHVRLPDGEVVSVPAGL